ncbi:MAG: BPSL0067 family protein [Bacteroidota bacterium]
MAYKLNVQASLLEDNASFKNESGNHECVVFIQMASTAPNTTMWKKGVKVMDTPPGTIPSGTVIATFDETGNYPPSQRHAAIYVSHNLSGIVVYDQWNSQGKVKKRKIRNQSLSHRTVNDASYFYVVE